MSKVRKIRQDRGLSMEKLARLADVSMHTIANIEHGAGARLSTMHRIAVALDVRVDDLVEDVEAVS